MEMFRNALKKKKTILKEKQAILILSITVYKHFLVPSHTGH